MPPRIVPLLVADSERVRAIKTGLNRYFAAVSLRLDVPQNSSTDDKVGGVEAAAVVSSSSSSFNSNSGETTGTTPLRVGRAQKLAAIADAFSADAQLITKTSVYSGRDQVQSFYASPDSPVMKDPNFRLSITDLSTVCVSADENTIAVEIKLTETMTVGDWFTFNDEAKIKRMRIYF